MPDFAEILQIISCIFRRNISVCSLYSQYLHWRLMST